jgi:hypothetical protein
MQSKARGAARGHGLFQVSGLLAFDPSTQRAREVLSVR